LAVAAIASPTFHSGTAVADGQKPAGENSAANKSESATKTPSANTSVGGVQGTVTVGGSLEPMIGQGHPNDLSFPFYQPLLNSRTRKQLNLSSEQEKTLFELDRRYRVELMREVRKLSKQWATLPPEKRETVGNEIATQMHEKVKPIRMQVEGLLSAEQLEKLRTLVVLDQYSPVGFLCNSKISLTEEQKEELSQIASLEQKLRTETLGKTLQAQQANDEEAMAVLTPEQLRQVERHVGEIEFGRPILFGEPLDFLFTTTPGVGHVSCLMFLEPHKELGLSDEQVTKLNAIFVESQFSQELYQGRDYFLRLVQEEVQSSGAGGGMGGGMWMMGGGAGTTAANKNRPAAERQDVKSAKVQQKWEDLKKQLCEQIEGVLTPEQMDTLKSTALQQSVARITRQLWLRKPDSISVSETQIEKLRQLNEERNETELRLWNAVKEDAMNALTPELREKCMQEAERRGWWLY
jgi:hypothetical protein